MSKYDYSLMYEDYPDGYVKSTDKIRIICPIHGIFVTRISCHKISKQECPHCSGNMQNGYWTKERCKADAKKYKTKIEWKKNSGSAYGNAWRNKWFNECCGHMLLTRLDNYWTKEKNIKIAKQYKTIVEWRLYNYKSYISAWRNEWLDECCSHMIIKIRKWTLELCIDDALKYKSKSEWELNSLGAYKAACRNKWLDECCLHMNILKKSAGYWTKKRCIEDAKKYKTKSEWAKSGSASMAAYNNGWYKECCKHMVSGHKNCKTSIV